MAKAKKKSTKKSSPKKSQAVPAYFQEMYRLAVRASENAHAPYSEFQIGSCVRMSDGTFHSGCNVENASYGGTICAERAAIFKAVSEFGAQPITDVVVVSDTANPWPPCGFCRQVIAEFATPETKIFSCNHNGAIKQFYFKEIFPESFSPNHLKD